MCTNSIVFNMTEQNVQFLVTEVKVQGYVDRNIMWRELGSTPLTLFYSVCNTDLFFCNTRAFVHNIAFKMTEQNVRSVQFRVTEVKFSGCIDRNIVQKKGTSFNTSILVCDTNRYEQ